MSSRSRRRREKLRNSKSPKSFVVSKNVSAIESLGIEFKSPVPQKKYYSSPKREPHAATLATIQDMFLGMDPGLIEQIYITLNCDSMKVIDYILEHKNEGVKDKVVTPKETKNRGPSKVLVEGEPEASLSGIPVDVYLHICEHLDLFALGKLSVVCRTLETYSQAVYERTTELNFYRYRHWKDGNILAMIARFPSLTTLSLRKCVDFDSFKLLPQSCFASAATIKVLNFGQCYELRDEDLSRMLETLERLEELDVSSSIITDDTIELLVKSPALKYLNLMGCNHVTGKAVKRLIMDSKSLKSLNLQGTSMTSDLLSVFHRSVSLEKINLSRCKRLSTCVMGSKTCRLQDINLSDNVGLRQVELHCPALTSLNLSLCKYLVSFIMPLSAPGWKFANLSGNVNLTEVKIEKPSSLIELNLYGCRSLTSDSLEQIISSSTHSLSNINCGAMIQLNYRMLSGILRTCPVLVEMELNGCKGIPTAAVKAAKEVLREHASVLTKGEKNLLIEDKSSRQETKSRTPERHIRKERSRGGKSVGS